MTNPFDLSGRVAVITGGAGLLGLKHGEAIASAGGVPVLVDIDARRAASCAEDLRARYGVPAAAERADITSAEEVRGLVARVLSAHGRVDILINNAANNPKMEAAADVDFSRLEHFTMAQWEADLSVGLTGAFLCAQAFGSEMAAGRGGVILNVASDLSVIAPDQRLYRDPSRPEDQQPVKPVTYSVVKAGLVGLTRYLATYWADRGVRANALSPGGVFNGQPQSFVRRLEGLIPLGRMASVDEYKGAVLFLCSDASAYMTGQNVVMDGGRSVW